MRIIITVPILLVVLICGIRDVNGQELQGNIQKAVDCCNIVSVDQAAHQIVVREIATGLTKTLTIANTELLQQLQPGAAYGPGAIDGIEKPPGDFEPDWAEDCCNFRALPQGLRNVGTSAQGMTADLRPDVTITLQSLKRLGRRVVRLDFSVRNDSGDRVHLNNVGLLDDIHYSLRNVSMIDYDAGLRYGALIDSEGTCACSRGSSVGTIGVGQERDYWVQIKAPPENINEVSVDFAGKASIDNIPIGP